jgi:hypothetical protein
VATPRPRGAIPTPRHKLMAAMPHRVVGTTPSQFIVIPSQLSMWGNGPDPLWPVSGGSGNCVSAEEAAAKAAFSVMSGGPEVFITDATLYAWCQKNGTLNGAEVLQVVQWMEAGGFVQADETYNDGPVAAVDWTNAALLQNAISIGPVKLGVCGDPLENVVGSTNGWFGTGFAKTTAAEEDHSVGCWGFGSISWLANQLGVSVPTGIDSTQPGYAIYTWGTIGILDVPSFLNITWEAWLRNPTTAGVVPAPTPTPTPTPAPTPAPEALFSLKFPKAIPIGHEVEFKAPVPIPAGTYTVMPGTSASDYTLAHALKSEQEPRKGKK